jgi:hypothetical protein
MDKVADTIKLLASITSNSSVSFLLMGIVFIVLPSATNDLVFWGWRINVDLLDISFGALFFSSGLFLVLFSLYPFAKNAITIEYYRRKYPVSMLEKDFFVVDIKGNVFLIDVPEKKIRWIQNWQTLSDLKLNGYLLVLFSHKKRLTHWSNYTSGEIEAEARKKLGAKLTKSGFSFGEGIHTRGIPGT